jgi:HAD superfamily hydrolase (TIGR01509 family)
MIKAVTFDAGDTLVDLGEGRGDYEARSLVRAGRVFDVLAGGGLLLAPRGDFCPAFVADIETRYQAALVEQKGLVIHAALREYFDQNALKVDEVLLRAAAGAYCGSGTTNPTPLRLGARETLAALRARGLRMGLISNTIQPAQYLDVSMDRNGLGEFLAVRVYSSEVGLAKPHPGIFRAALAALDLAPEEVVHVGDRLVADIAGAQGAGMTGILIEVPQRTEFDPRITPEARIRELPELLEVLDRM